MVARQIWFESFSFVNQGLLAPDESITLTDWWTAVRKGIPREQKKGFDILVILILLQLWKKHNARVFSNKYNSMLDITPFGMMVLCGAYCLAGAFELRFWVE